MTCEVCNGKVVDVSLYADVDTYMCEKCKAVYYPSGKRNPAFKSIYDVGDKFAAMHQNLLAGGPSPVGVSSPATRAADYMERSFGIKPGEPVQVFYRGRWRWAKSLSVNPGSNTMRAIITGHKRPFIYQHRNWKDGKDGKLPPTQTPAAPHSDLAKILRNTTGADTLPVKLAGPDKQVKLICYVPRRSASACKAATIPAKDITKLGITRAVGMSRVASIVPALGLYYVPGCGGYTVFDHTSGVVFGVGSNKKRLVGETKSMLRSVSSDWIKQQVSFANDCAASFTLTDVDRLVKSVK